MYIRDDREKNEYFGLCEVQVFSKDGKRNVRINVIPFVNLVDGLTCGRPEEPMGSLINISEGIATYECEPGYILKGDRDIVCKQGEWTGQVPRCQGLCLSLLWGLHPFLFRVGVSRSYITKKWIHRGV